MKEFQIKSLINNWKLKDLTHMSSYLHGAWIMSIDTEDEDDINFLSEIVMTKREFEIEDNYLNKVKK